MINDFVNALGLTFNLQEEREDQQGEAGLILEETDRIEASQ